MNNNSLAAASIHRRRSRVAVFALLLFTLMFAAKVHESTFGKLNQESASKQHHDFSSIAAVTRATNASKIVLPLQHKNDHPEIADRRRCIIVHLHFHKAGGTSILSYFKKLKLVRCGLRRKIILANAGDPEFWGGLKSKGKDFVSLEGNFLTPDQMKNSSKSCIHFLTTLRDPWRRFRSTYERELWLACQDKREGAEREDCIAQNSLSKWMQEREYQFPRHSLWGGILAPNYYIRMLNGINYDSHHEVLSEFHLEQAKSVMRRFDLVTLLEDTRDMKNKLDTFFNTSTDDDLPSISNNYLKSWPSYETIVGKSNEQRDLFEKQNRLDLEFYNWVKEEMIPRSTTPSSRTDFHLHI